MAARTVPLVRQFTAGEVEVGAYLNALGKALGFLLGPPVCQARQTVSQSLATATWTSLLLDTEDLDSDGAHSTVTNTSRFTTQVAGTYLCAGGVGHASNATGYRGACLAVNGTFVNGSVQFANAVNGQITGLATRTMLIALNAGDYLEVQGFQNTGGALGTAVTTQQQSHLTAHLVSR
jgi:hypothetical protein